MKKTGFSFTAAAIVLAAILALTSLPGCSSKTTTVASTTTSASAQPIKTYTIGLCAELTGFLGAYNTATVNEAQIAVDMVNEKGGGCFRTRRPESTNAVRCELQSDAPQDSGLPFSRR